MFFCKGSYFAGSLGKLTTFMGGKKQVVALEGIMNISF